MYGYRNAALGGRKADSIGSLSSLFSPLAYEGLVGFHELERRFADRLKSMCITIYTNGYDRTS